MPQPTPQSTPQPAITWRSVAIGFTGVFFVCGLTYYNDFVLRNTFLIGNFLPIGLILFFLLVVFGVNVPLRWRRPALALRGSELGVAMAMMLVGCAVPGSGLMRYLPPGIAGLAHYSNAERDLRAEMSKVNLPSWLFPVTAANDVAGRATDPVITDFVTDRPFDEPSLLGRIRETPWGAWLRPLCTWGVFVAAMWGAVIFGALIVRRQWVENERLAFPLAEVYLAMIEAPTHGRLLNKLFRSRSFWAAFGTVFLIHAANSLHLYWPNSFPEIPLGYNFAPVFTDQPWVNLDGWVKAGRVYFCVIGICFFLQTSLGFSLWFAVIVYESWRMASIPRGLDMTAGNSDQMFGAMLAVGATILWVGRSHFAVVGRQMIRGRVGNEPRGHYLSYRTIGWIFIACCAVMAAWLVAAGCTAVAAIVTVGLAMLCFLVLARVVAETGLMFVQINYQSHRPWVQAVSWLGDRGRTTMKSFVMSSVVGAIFTNDMRESLPVFATHALRVSEQAMSEENDVGNAPSAPRSILARRSWRDAPAAFIGLLFLSLAFGYVVSAASTIFIEYSYASSVDEKAESPVNIWGVNSTRNVLLPAVRGYITPVGTQERHNRRGHFVAGMAIAGGLAALRLRYAWWPMHPIGYLLLYTYVLNMIWFSLLIGWLAKALILRFGGLSLYRASKPLFIGLIFGEASAAAFWLVVTLILQATGHSYKTIMLMPG